MKNTKNEMIEEMLYIAEDFNKWLEDMSEKYGWDKDDIQEFIKRALT